MKAIEKVVTVGDALTLSLALQTKAASAQVWSDTTITAATVMAYEEGQDTQGQATGGSISSLTDTARTEGADFWNGRVIELQGGDNDGEARVISDFASGVFTLNVTGDALPAAIASGDQYLIQGYPIIYQQNMAAGSLSTNTANYQINTGTGLTSTPRIILVLLQVSYLNGSNTDKTTAKYRVRVEAV